MDWRSGGVMEVRVQGLVVWSARGIKLDEYERVVGERLSMGGGGEEGMSG